MLLTLPAAFRALIRPRKAFARPLPAFGEAVQDMLMVWVPLVVVNAFLTVWRALQAYEAIRRGGLPSSMAALIQGDPADVQQLLRGLPPPPSFDRIWPWLLVLVPLGVLGIWLHDAVWDHAGLWLLGGLKEKRGFRTTLIAEAEALRIAAVGTLVGLLGFLPYVGVILMIPLMLLGSYLWLFRGFALAARHGCEVWRGLAATVVHAVLLGCWAAGLFALMAVMLRAAA